MTLLSVLSDALLAFDNAIAARRGGGVAGNGTNPMLVPIPANQPVQLSSNDEARLITYADSVATYPAIFGVWSKILRNLATTDIGVYREKDPSDPTKLERVHGTNLEELLRKPAPGKGLVDLLQWLFNPYLVEGNGLLAKYRGDGADKPPTNLLPLDWRYMSALAIPGGPVEHWISYQIGEPRAFLPKEVVHLAWCSPNGSEIGPSPLRSLGTGIRLDDSAARYQVASFDNGSRPAGALVIPKDATTTPADRAEMQEKVKALHQGVDNAFRVAVLFGGIEWQPMSFSAVEAELDSTRRRSQEEVCIAYDVRRSVIAERESGPPTDLKEVLRDFQRSLKPHTALAANVIQRQLIDPEPEWAEEKLCVRFDLSDLIRGTFDEEAETAGYLYTNGIAARDEARKRVGLEELGRDEDCLPLTPHAQLKPEDVGKTPDARRLMPS